MGVVTGTFLVPGFVFLVQTTEPYHCTSSRQKFVQPPPASSSPTQRPSIDQQNVRLHPSTPDGIRCATLNWHFTRRWICGLSCHGWTACRRPFSVPRRSWYLAVSDAHRTAFVLGRVIHTMIETARLPTRHLCLFVLLHAEAHICLYELVSPCLTDYHHTTPFVSLLSSVLSAMIKTHVSYAHPVSTTTSYRGVAAPLSCAGHCGLTEVLVGLDGSKKCTCDHFCERRGDCCEDFFDLCVRKPRMLFLPRSVTSRSQCDDCRL